MATYFRHEDILVLTRAPPRSVWTEVVIDDFTGFVESIKLRMLMTLSITQFKSELMVLDSANDEGPA